MFDLKMQSNLDGVPVPLPNRVILFADQNGALRARLSDGSVVGRETLTANRTYFVRKDGSDANSGLTNDGHGSFLTIQRAIDEVCKIDPADYQVTVQIAAGNYQGVMLKKHMGAKAPIVNGLIIDDVQMVFISGQIQTTYSAGEWSLSNMQVDGIVCVGVSTVKLGEGICFGPCSNHQMQALYGGMIIATASYSIVGGPQYGSHAYAISGGIIKTSNCVVDLSGSVNFSLGFVRSDFGGGYFEMNSMTFIGSATGKRFDLKRGSVCSVFTANLNYFPGNSPGSVETGAVYG